MNQNYLFLYLKTGGGHLSPARSVARYIQAKHQNNISIDLFDGFTKAHKVVKFLIEDGYRLSQAKAIWIFEAMYALNKIEFLARLTTIFVSFFVKGILETQIEKSNPQKIVIFHFLLIRPVLQIVKEKKLDIPVFVIVTDPFTAHPVWFLDKTPKFIVFSERLKELCISKGIHENKIAIFPFIIDEKFTQPIPQIVSKTIRKNIGLDENKKIVLIFGGGDGIPKGKKILKTFLKNNPEAYVIIVCGNNQSLYKKAWKLKTAYGFENLKIFPFVDFIHELISISDIVITKCGASTFMEILFSGKIPVINNYIWEQEKGNMEFVRDNNLGIYEKNIKKLPLTAKNMLKSPIF